MVKKAIILLVYTFCSFTLIVCVEKDIFPNLTKSQEPELVFFGPLEPEPEPLEKNTRSRSRLGKKSGAGAA